MALQHFLTCLAFAFLQALGISAQLARHGFLDVTAPPYSVDNTGRTDCTKQLQKAVEDARAKFLVAFLPHGTYLVSDTITLLQQDPWYSSNSSYLNNTWPDRFQPNVVVGARARWQSGSQDPLRPIIRLADNAPGFSDPNHPMPVLDFTRKNNGHKPVVDGTNFNQLLKGVDVHIGRGTPFAVGVMLPGAQGCAVADATIHVGSGYAGITGGSGAGGGHAMVKIIGGRIGLDYTVALNAPGTTGVVLINQTEAGIMYDGTEAASFAGATVNFANASVPVLKSRAEGSKYGQVSMVDSIIEYAQDSADELASCLAFDTSHSLYLRNVYVKNCHSLTVGIKGTASGWAKAEEVAVGVPIPTPGRACGNASMPVYLNGVKSPQALLASVVTKGVVPPPQAIVAKHRWEERTFPTFDMPQVLAVDSFGAKGDGNTDDSEAIQRAVDAATKSGGIVFLPKGFYRVSRTINMTASALVGTARSLTVLMPMSEGLPLMGPGGPFPILHVPTSTSSHSVIITMLSIVTWEHLDSVWALWWQNSNSGSIYRDNYFYRITECFFGFPYPKPVPVQYTSPTIPCKPAAILKHPLNLLSDGAAGKFYNFENEDFLYEGPSYRHMLILNTTGPVQLYNMNFEHASSEANAEFRDSSNIDVFSLKSEGEWRDLMLHGGMHNPAVALWLRNCSDVNLYSFGGNARPRPTGSTYPPNFAPYPPSQYRIEDSCPVRITNCVDQFQFSPDNDWNFIYESYLGKETLTAHCERPVAYSRTTCSAHNAMIQI